MTALDRRPQRLFWSVGAVYVLTWVWISWLSSPSLDPYGDMVENYAWSQTPAWGTFKHPPLFAWIVGAWFAVFPTSVWPYYLLSYLNAGLGVLGIVALAKLWLPENLSAVRRDAYGVAVLLFAVLSLPYSNLAAKFNADTILLSLWPWTAYAFFAAAQAGTARRQWASTAFLGVMAAACLLAKYFSVLLLVTFVIVSLSHRDYRRWYRTISPYAALALGLLLVLPHAIWETRMDFPFRQYLESKIDPSIDLGRIALFLLSGIYYLPLSWLAWMILRSRFSNAERQPVAWAIPLRGLLFLCIVPSLLTVSFNVFARVHLTTHWAIPVWFALPVLMAVWLLPRVADDFDWNALGRGLAIFWVALLTGAAIYTAVLSVTGNPKYSLARQEMVRTIEARFATRFPAQRLAWAGGSWPESGALSFFAAEHPRGLPGFPDEPRAAANPYEAWPDRYGVIVCYPSASYAHEGSHDAECEDRTRGWLHTHHRPIVEDTLNYRAEGWRYVRADPKNVTVFWIAPALEKSTP